MCIDDPLPHHDAWYHRLYDTHPPIEERIAELEKSSRARPSDVAPEPTRAYRGDSGCRWTLGACGRRRPAGGGYGRRTARTGKLTSGTARSSSSVAKNATAVKPNGPGGSFSLVNCLQSDVVVAGARVSTGAPYSILSSVARQGSPVAAGSSRPPATGVVLGDREQRAQRP